MRDSLFYSLFHPKNRVPDDGIYDLRHARGFFFNILKRRHTVEIRMRGIDLDRLIVHTLDIRHSLFRTKTVSRLQRGSALVKLEQDHGIVPLIQLLDRRYREMQFFSLSLVKINVQSIRNS